ncbi:MAG TPA: response regulator [Candidatus Binatia bacterium]|jgi:two-component system LytT family response regulator|nr:response regulator [Candidatus Binatia bacterium]
MSIRTLIVDDEPLARERVRTLLKEEPDIEVIGECGNGAEAVAAVKKHLPDLLFLDVQMPGLGGFEVLRALDRERLPLTIFVTAHDQHALKAFEVHALDYLLKPFKQARFRQTVQRAREALANQQAGTVSKNLVALLGQARPAREHLTRIPVRIGERIVFVKTEQVEYIESAGNYVVVHAGKENHVVRDTLTALEEKLDPKKFLRISRSTLVNLDQIKELQPLFKGEHAVLLRNGKQLTMTRGIREIQEALKFS